MVQKTLLQIMTDACQDIGLTTPSAVIGSTDQTIITMLAMSNRGGRDIVRDGKWTGLQRVHTFSTASGTAEYSLPSDYSRILPDTVWNRSTYEPLQGPIDAAEWQEIKSGLVGSGIVGQRWRIFRASSGVGKKLYIDPTPTATETIAFEYVSDHWICATDDTTTKAAWTVDTDYGLIDGDLLTLDVIVRFRRSKGLAWASEADEYNSLFDKLYGQDKPAKTLDLACGRVGRLLGYGNIPETGYGS